MPSSIRPTAAMSWRVCSSAPALWPSANPVSKDSFFSVSYCSGFNVTGLRSGALAPVCRPSKVRSNMNLRKGGASVIGGFAAVGVGLVNKFIFLIFLGNNDLTLGGKIFRRVNKTRLRFFDVAQARWAKRGDVFLQQFARAFGHIREEQFLDHIRSTFQRQR